MADTTKRTTGMHPMSEEEMKHEASDMATAVKEKAKDLASSAADAASQAGSKAREWASSAAQTASQKAGDARSAVGGGMENLADKIREKAPEQGMFGTAASTVADQIEAAGSYIREHGLRDIGHDFTDLVRRYPIPSLLIGLGLGFLLARATSTRT